MKDIRLIKTVTLSEMLKHGTTSYIVKAKLPTQCSEQVMLMHFIKGVLYIDRDVDSVGVALCDPEDWSDGGTVLKIVPLWDAYFLHVRAAAIPESGNRIRYYVELRHRM